MDDLWRHRRRRRSLVRDRATSRPGPGVRRPPRIAYDNPEDRPTPERCLSGVGTPPMTTLNYATRLRIVQTRDHVVLHMEYGDDVRIVRLAAEHGPRAALASQLGDSIAH